MAIGVELFVFLLLLSLCLKMLHARLCMLPMCVSVCVCVCRWLAASNKSPSCMLLTHGVAWTWTWTRTHLTLTLGVYMRHWAAPTSLCPSPHPAACRPATLFLQLALRLQCFVRPFVGAFYSPFDWNVCWRCNCPARTKDVKGVDVMRGVGLKGCGHAGCGPHQSIWNVVFTAATAHCNNAAIYIPCLCPFPLGLTWRNWCGKCWVWQLPQPPTTPPLSHPVVTVLYLLQ